ncbi:MAG TPA: DUF58 domain-containing protein [Humisphaera sp.]
MWPFRTKSSVPRFRRRPAIDFSLTGLVYCCVMMLLGLAAINHNINLLFGVFGLMIGVLLVAGVLSRRMLARLPVHRTLPDHAVVGTPATVEYAFTNKKRYWPSLAVSAYELDGAGAFAAQPQAYLMHAAAGRTVAVRAEVVPTRRGVQPLDRFQLATGFPFGFVRRATVHRQADKLLVYPAIGQVDRAVLQWCRAAEHSGAAVRPRQGGQDEFYGVKEHRRGDNPRHIHWKRSARTVETGGTLVAREMTRVAPPKLVLLVDTWLTDPSKEERARVERSIAMAASLAARALEEDLTVGMVAWGGDGWRRIEPGRGKRLRSDLLSALARLPQNVTHDTAQLLDQASRLLRNHATGVLFTPRALPAGVDPTTRGAIAVLPAESDEAKRWFQFGPKVDFAA